MNLDLGGAAQGYAGPCGSYLVTLRIRIEHMLTEIHSIYTLTAREPREALCRVRTFESSKSEKRIFGRTHIYTNHDTNSPPRGKIWPLTLYLWVLVPLLYILRP